MKQQYYDVVIVGCGVGGLYTALHLPSDTRILMLSKEELKTCDSMLAQGVICVLRDEDDYDSYSDDDSSSSIPLLFMKLSVYRC